MHTTNCGNSGLIEPCEVLDYVDDVNDVVL